MVFSATRNYLASKEKYNLTALVTVFTANAVLGLLLNTGGTVGLIPVVATLFLTVTAYFLHEPHVVRVAVMINIGMWVVYGFLISDYVTAVTNSVAFLINAVTLTVSLLGKSK